MEVVVAEEAQVPDVGREGEPTRMKPSAGPGGTGNGFECLKTHISIHKKGKRVNTFCDHIQNEDITMERAGTRSASDRIVSEEREKGVIEIFS